MPIPRNATCFVPTFCRRDCSSIGIVCHWTARIDRRPRPGSIAQQEWHTPIHGPNLRGFFARWANPWQHLGARFSGRFEPERSTKWSSSARLANRSTVASRLRPAIRNTSMDRPGSTHLHRLRALVDAVVIGVGTALADDPQLTVRRVAGPHPARVVVDPNGRLAASAKVFANDGVRRLLITAEGTQCSLTSEVEVLALPASDGRIAPPAILAALAERGLRRILIEGGADTVSRLPHCRLPRPSACDGCTDHPRRRRTCELHLAPDRAGRSGFAHADTRPSTRRRGTVRLRSVGSACAGRPRENIDMTDAD